ncbi:MAG: FkbM family methyltransferase [Candidatus Saccharibacteria bacterium]|nr:FkbM family methyltransferase [Candidatus Saccharibacteria bacterium]
MSLISYAQNREDIILHAMLGSIKNGFYIDVGANHPVHESVTKLFYDQGWHGINVEPSHRLHALLELTRPRDINVKVGISDKDATLSFREYLSGDGLSTFSKETQAEYEKNSFYSFFAREYVDYKVPVITLKELCTMHAKETPIDFMKIDVEGYEYEAISGGDWKRFRPKILCIEANHIVNDWHPILEKAKYQKVFWDGLNEYFVAVEHAAILKDFSYANAMFLGEPFVDWSEQKIRDSLHIENAVLQYQLDKAAIQHQADVIALAPPESKIKHTLKRVDHKITALLGERTTSRTASNVQPDITSFDDVVKEIRLQLAVTQPPSQVSKRAALRGYSKAKLVARKAAKKARS